MTENEHDHEPEPRVPSDPEPYIVYDTPTGGVILIDPRCLARLLMHARLEREVEG